MPLRQNGRPHSNVREDHSSKSVEPKARYVGTAIPNQASEERGRRRDWMASIPFTRDEGTVRLSAKAESDRITRRSSVQICPRNHFVIQKAGIQDSGLFRATVGGSRFLSRVAPASNSASNSDHHSPLERLPVTQGGAGSSPVAPARPLLHSEAP